MAVGTAAALTGVGALASAFGGSKKQTTSENVSGYQALPKEVQDLLLEQYFPKAQSTLNMPYQNIPMQRATNPMDDPFASQAMWDLQKFSDAAGGYFSPMAGTTPPGVVSQPSYQGAAGNIAMNGGSAQPIGGMAPTSAQGGGDMSAAQNYINSLKGTSGKGTQNAYALQNALQSGQITAADIMRAVSAPQGGNSLTSGGVNLPALLNRSR